MAEGGAQRHHARVVGLVEVREPVQAAAGEEERRGAGGEAPVERGVEQLGAGRSRGRARSVSSTKAPIASERCGASWRSHDGGQRVPALPQAGDDLEILDERAQLRGRAEVELHAAVHVERLIERVDLRAQHVRVARALVERERIDDLRGVAAREQARLAQRSAEPVRDRAGPASTRRTAVWVGTSRVVVTCASRRSSW